jgi:hypothetical protein
MTRTMYHATVIVVALFVAGIALHFVSPPSSLAEKGEPETYWIPEIGKHLDASHFKDATEKNPRVYAGKYFAASSSGDTWKEIVVKMNKYGISASQQGGSYMEGSEGPSGPPKKLTTTKITDNRFESKEIQGRFVTIVVHGKVVKGLLPNLGDLFYQR